MDTSLTEMVLAFGGGHGDLHRVGCGSESLRLCAGVRQHHCAGASRAARARGGR